MTEILVKPSELRMTVRELQQHARKLQRTIQVVDEIIHTLGPVHFDGQLASVIRVRHRAIQDRMQGWPGLLEKFNKDLHQVAALFELADKG